MKIELSDYRASVKHWKGPAVQICRGLALEPAFNAQDTSHFVEQNAHGDSSATSSLILANLFRHAVTSLRNILLSGPCAPPLGWGKGVGAPQPHPACR